MLYNDIAVFTAPQTIAIKQESVNEIPPNYVCVKYLYCGICGSDHSIFLGRRKNYPISLGHEFVGEIIAVGSNIDKFHRGQIVVSDFNYRCGKCVYCLSGRSYLCVHNEAGYFSNRGFSNYGVIHANYLTVISPPPYLPRACLIEPLSCVIHACNRIGAKNNMRILLCGGGGIGMLFCFYLSRICGNSTIEVHESIEERMCLLESRFSVSRYCKDSNKDYDFIIDCTNTTSGLAFSLSQTPVGGNICVFSHLYGLETSFVYEEICKKELNCMFPLRNGDSKNLELSAELINNYWDCNDDVLLSIYESISKAFCEKASSPSCKQIINSQHLLP